MVVSQLLSVHIFVAPNSACVAALKTQILPVIIHHQQKLFQTNSIQVFWFGKEIMDVFSGCKS